MGWSGHKNTTEKAIKKQAMDTQGLSRSPTRANFQNKPRNLHGQQRRATASGSGRQVNRGIAGAHAWARQPCTSLH